MDVVDSLSTASGADTVPSLDFDLITTVESENLWCEQCKVFKKNYEKLQEEHALSYNTLKKKIISTDLLIKKYKSKCEDHDQQTRKLEDSVKKQEQLQREAETLQSQLSAALRQIEPLKQEKLVHDQEKRRQLQEIQTLQDQIVAGESFKTQYEQLNRSLLEGKEKHDQEIKDANKRIRELEQSQQKQEIQLTKLKEENKVLKKENSRFQKREKKTEESLTKAQENVERFGEILFQNGLLPKKDRLQWNKRRVLLNGKGAGPATVTEGSSSLEEDDLVDPGFVSDQETDLPQTKARCQHTLTVRKIGITHTEGERKAPMEPPEEEGSLMEFPFAFSPLVSVLSPLPPSPQSYRKEVEDNEDSDEDLEEMAEQLEQVFTNSPRRSPRKRVPPSPLSRDPNTTLKTDRGGISKEAGQEMMKDGKQVTVHNRREDGSLKGSQDGILGGKSGGPVGLKGIKRITFTCEEMDTQGEVVNSEVALVNPKPILSGHHNSAFQKFSKSNTPKQERKTEEKSVLQPSSEADINECSRMKSEDGKERVGNHTNMHHKRIRCLRQHAFRPVSVSQEDSNASDSVESTGFTIKLTESQSDSKEKKGNDVQNHQNGEETFRIEQHSQDKDMDIDSVLSIRTLRKSLSLPEGKTCFENVGASSPGNRKKRISSVPHKGSNKDSRKFVSELKIVPENPRLTLTNKTDDRNGQKIIENNELSEETCSKETIQCDETSSSRLARTQTLPLSTSDVDTLCQRSRSRMKIPSGRKRDEGVSVTAETLTNTKEIKKENIGNKCGHSVVKDAEKVEDSESSKQLVTTLRQDSLGFALRSPPVLKSPPIVLPSHKGLGIGASASKAQQNGPLFGKEKNTSTKADGELISEDSSMSSCAVKGSMEKNSAEILEEKDGKNRDYSNSATKFKSTVEISDNSNKNDMCKVHVISDRNISVDLLNKVCSKPSENESSKEKNEGVIEEPELPRQESMGFVLSGDSMVEAEMVPSDSDKVEQDLFINIKDSSGIISQEEKEQLSSACDQERILQTDSGTKVSVQQVSEIVVLKTMEDEQSVNVKSDLQLISQDASKMKRLKYPGSDRDIHGEDARKSVDQNEGSAGETLSEGNSETVCDVNGGKFNRASEQVIGRRVLQTSKSSGESVNTLNQPSVCKRGSVSTNLSQSTSANLSGDSDSLAQMKQQKDVGNSKTAINAPSSIQASTGASRRPPTSFPPEGSRSSSIPVYIPSLSKFVQKSRFSAVVASSTVVSPEMEDLPSHHPHTHSSPTPRSPSSLSAGGPVSPLPPSPYHFFLPNPISPLPPSPVGEVVPISPLCTSPFDLEESSINIHIASSESQRLSHQSVSTKTSIASSVKQTSIVHHRTAAVQIAKETRPSQSCPSGKKIVQSDASPRTFHAVAPPDAIPVKAQTAVKGKSGSQSTATRKRRSLDQNVPTPEVAEKKQCFEKNAPAKKDATSLAEKVDLYKVIEAEMKHYINGTEITCQEMVDKLVLLADQSVVSSHLLQWTIQYLRCQEVEMFGTIHCYCAYSSDCQSRTDPFLTPGEARLLQFYSCLFQNQIWAPQRQQLINMLWSAIFSQDSLTLTSKLALCRFYVGRLLDAGDMEQVRVFFYHVMTCRYLNAPMVAVAIAGVWPQCLYRNSSATSPVLVVMEACIMRELQELQEKGAKIAVCLKKLVNWDHCVHQNNVLLQHLVKEIENKCTDFHSNQGEIYELRRAAELLLVMQKVGFFKTVFIGVAVGALNSKLRSKRVKVAEHYIGVIIQITASVLMQLTSMNEKSKSQIIRKYITKILLSDLASPDLQLSIAQTLLELSFLSPVTVMSGSLYPWFLANKNIIPPNFVSNLEQTRQILIGQFPYLKCPEFVLEKLGNMNL